VLKLTRHLFCWDPQAEYADYYERALYNHILASQNPATGMMCYYVPLKSGSRKEYCGREDSFWCCTGTGVENHAKYGDSIYFHDGDQTLYVNLFIASELTWKAKGLSLSQMTKYPEEARTSLLFDCSKPTELSLKVRHPYWAVEGIRIRVNGQPEALRSTPGAYATVNRKWKRGDNVEVSFPMSLRTEGFRDNPRRLAFLHGPLVLCAQVDLNKPLPAVVAQAGQILKALQPVPGQASTFKGPAEFFRVPGLRASAGITLEPFYKMHGDRHYAVYWDLFTPEQWKTKEDEYLAELARQKELEARTIDRVNPGEEQNEREHRLAGDKTSAGDFGGRKWRHATDGGWFAFELKVLPDTAQELCVTYWGSDAGGREFDILVDGDKLATQKLENNRPGKFYDEVYQLTEKQSQGKSKLTVKFQAHPGQWAGGVFGVRVLKPRDKTGTTTPK
jgi:hypothetical protein